MSTTPGLPLWVQDREEVLKQDDGVEWRDGNRPDYSRTKCFLVQGKETQSCRRIFECDRL